MANDALTPCLRLGKPTQVPDHISVAVGEALELFVHICPLGYFSWQLAKSQSGTVGQGTAKQVDAQGVLLTINRFKTKGTYELTWGCASLSNGWAAASIIRTQKDGVVFRRTRSTTSPEKLLLFGVQVRAV